MDSPTINIISLFSGVGMLDEGVAAGLRYLGFRSRTVCFAEREAYPASVLAARMEEGSLHPAPIWFGDCTELPAEYFHGMVDGIVAGFPCQDISIAGRRIGLDGKRSGLFFEIPKLADACGAWFILLENVAGIASATASVVDEAEGELDERAAARVVGELADLGWHAEWITLSASDVGASHGRARWFCLAWRMGSVGHAGFDAGNAEQREQSKSTASRPGKSGADCVNVGIAARVGRSEGCPESTGQQGRHDAAVDGGAVAYAPSARCGGWQIAGSGREDARARTWSVEPERGCAILADTDGTGQRAIGQRERGAPNAASNIVDMADAGSARPQGREFRAVFTARGGMKGDQLANFVAYSPLVPAISDGPELSPACHGSPQHSAPSKNSTPRLLSRRLNPNFGGWLMGWPLSWTSAIAHPSSNASEMALYRLKLDARLSCLLDEPACSAQRSSVES